MQPTRVVYFVYLGNSLPRYAAASMELASKYSGMQVHLLGNANVGRSVPRKSAHFTAIEDFYDSSEFSDAAKRVSFDHSFREGLFLRSLERFFVLEQYMGLGKIEAIFHAELDQLLFRTDRLVTELEETGERGLFIPFHDQNSAVASVFYCNSHNALRSLLDFSRKGDSFLHEMALLANWAAKNPSEVFALPTLASHVNKLSKVSSRTIRFLRASDVGGVVDAAQLGQWVAGIDPRNVPVREAPKTKFVDEPNDMLLSREQLSQVRFEFSQEDGSLVCRYGNIPAVNVYNLHIHSKIHNSLLRPNSALHNLFWLANQDKAVVLPGTRRQQILEYLNRSIGYAISNPDRVIASVHRRLNRFFKRRPE